MLRRIFLQDLGTKALALVLALAIYAHVFWSQERELVVRVPLQLRAIPAGLVQVGELPQEVRVRVRARGRDLFRLRTREFHAEVHLDAPTEGRLQRPLVSSDIRIPGDVHPTLVEVLEPRILTLVLEPAGRARLPVAVRLAAGAIPEGQALKRRPETDVGRVEVTGPRSVLARMDSVGTFPLQLSAGGSSQQHTVALDLPKGVTASPSKISVHVDLGPRVARHLGGFRVEAGPGAGARVMRFEPDSARLIVSGAAEVIQLIAPQRIRVLAGPIRGGEEGGKAALRAILGGLPADAVVTVQLQPESVRAELP